MRKFWQWLGTALVIAIFLSLANWQWNRAAELKNPPKIDQTVLPIDSLIAPAKSISADAIGRQVQVSGHYVSNWIAPNQGDKENPNWVVGLFETKDNGAILIVRGYSKGEVPVNTEPTRVTGYLVPQQSEDRAPNRGNQISRVDSSLFVDKTSLPLYAPFIIATEDPTSDLARVPFEVNSKVPGFYWQHISYVVIWFLFACTALFLMLYQRRLDKEGSKVKP